MIIVGAGTIGLLAMQCARELGAKSITAIDINPQKLALAKELGATHVFNSREMSAAEITRARKIFSLTNSCWKQREPRKL